MVTVLRALKSSFEDHDFLTPSPISWETLNQLISVEGAPSVDYERFSSIYDNSPELQNLVSFDQHGVTIKSGEPEITSAPKMTGEVERMAKSALPKEFK